MTYLRVARKLPPRCSLLLRRQAHLPCSRAGCGLACAQAPALSQKRETGSGRVSLTISKCATGPFSDTFAGGQDPGDVTWPGSHHLFAPSAFVAVLRLLRASKPMRRAPNRSPLCAVSYSGAKIWEVEYGEGQGLPSPIPDKSLGQVLQFV